MGRGLSLRDRFELLDVIVITIQFVALAVLLPVAGRHPDFAGAVGTSLLVVALTSFNALVIDPRFRRIALVARAGLGVFGSLWGYERANEIIALYWGSPGLERHFIAFDQAVFGGQATVWVQSLHHPALTEWLQAAYLSYFVLPLVLGFVLVASKRWESFIFLATAIVLATHQNFVWYVLVPIRSPFLVVETGEAAGTALSFDFELAGLWFAEGFRQSLLDSTTMRYDCFPSGHTCLTLTVMAVAWRSHRPAFWVLLPIGVSVVFSTLYLRYHYLVDLFAGAAVAAAIMWVTPRLLRWWARGPVQSRVAGSIESPSESGAD